MGAVRCNEPPSRFARRLPRCFPLSTYPLPERPEGVALPRVTVERDRDVVLETTLGRTYEDLVIPVPASAKLMASTVSAMP